MSLDRIPEEKKGKVKRKIAERASQYVSVSVARWIILAIATTLSTLLLTFGTHRATNQSYVEGAIADKTFRAPDDYKIRDEAATEERRLQASREVRRVFNSDPAMSEEAQSRISAAFDVLRDAGENVDEASLREMFEVELGNDVDDATWKQIQQIENPVEVAQAAMNLLGTLDGRLIVSRGELREGDRERGITVINVRADRENEKLLTDFTHVIELGKVRSLLTEASQEADIEQRSLAVDIAAVTVRPNLSYAPRITDERRARAADSVAEVFLIVPKGKIIIEEGHEVTSEQLEILSAIKSQDIGKKRNLARLLGLLILTAGVFGGMYFFGSRFTRVVPSGPKDLAVLASLVIIGLCLARLLYELQALQGASSSVIPPEAFPYVVPIPLIAMIAALLFDAQVAAFVAVTAALLAGQMFEGSLAATTSYFLSSIAAAGALEQPTRRLDVFKAGFAAAGATVAVTAAYALTAETVVPGQVVVWQIILGVIGGLLASVVAIGIVPAFEALGYVTNFRLQELGSLNNPLLRELNLRAPGTYNHSVIVGTLAEAAAESVGANPLFARVACYYHDIGKMRKPMYFIENQGGGENRHDKLQPSMSALIVEAHVKDGYEMALAHGLPQPIADIIPQHHGTRLISFFYNKARTQAEDAGEDPASILETDFRYPGPKPQTREAGIIMLADGCEAATRSIAEPTPAKVEGMIRRVFNMVWTDGQLDECDLTLKDLGLIAMSFKKSLLAIHHHRVAYPQTKDISGDRKKADTNGEKAEPKKAEPKKAADGKKTAHISDDFTVIPLPRDPRRSPDSGPVAPKRKKKSDQK